jgi:hypothetical protein
MPVTRAALREDGAVEQVEGGEQGGGAMADEVVGDPLDVAETQRQQRLGALQRLDLAFLVDTQDQRLVGRVEIQSDDVAQLLDEERIGGQLEAVAAMGLEAERLQEAMNAGLGDPGFGSQPAHAPMGRAIPGSTVQRRGEELRDALVVDRARFARTQLVMQALDAPGDETPAPLAHRRVGGPEAFRHRGVGRARGTSEKRCRRAAPALPATNATGRSTATAPAHLRSARVPLSVDPSPSRHLPSRRHPDLIRRIC